MLSRIARPRLSLIDEIAYRLVLASLAGSAVALTVMALYLVKSSLGIDLMDGPSPLHSLFYG